MKRSEMVTDVTEFMNDTFPDDIEWGDVDGDIILQFFEERMLPPMTHCDGGSRATLDQINGYILEDMDMECKWEDEDEHIK